MITIEWRKSTVRPWASVSRPSSRIWRRMLNTSGCAFSISSSRSTLYGFRPPASVSWPPPALGARPPPVPRDAGGGRPHKPRHGVLLHVLRHVDPTHRLLVAEEELG